MGCVPFKISGEVFVRMFLKIASLGILALLLTADAKRNMIVGSAVKLISFDGKHRPDVYI